MKFSQYKYENKTKNLIKSKSKISYNRCENKTKTKHSSEIKQNDG